MLGKILCWLFGHPAQATSVTNNKFRCLRCGRDVPLPGIFHDHEQEG